MVHFSGWEGGCNVGVMELTRFHEFFLGKVADMIIMIKKLVSE